MLGDISGLERIYIVCGYTDMRKSIDGLCAVVEEQLKLDPASSSLFLFCGRRCDRIKALNRGADGFVLIYIKLTVHVGYQLPRKHSEVRNLTWREFDWLMSGIDIDQPKALKKELKHAQKNACKPHIFGIFQESYSFRKTAFSGIKKVSKPRRKSVASSAKDIQLRELKDTISQLNTIMS